MADFDRNEWPESIGTAGRLRPEWVADFTGIRIVSGSPEEREIYVGDIVTAQNPKIVLCSAQYREDVTGTFKYFLENGYFIFTHWLNPGYSDCDILYFDYLGI